MLVAAYPLSLLLLIPAIGAAVVCLLPSGRDRLLKWAALIASLATFLWSAVLFRDFDNQSGSFQMVEQADWFRAAGFQVQYILGLDGISLLLVLLTTVLIPLALLSSWNVKDKLKLYLASILLLEVGILGVFLALDLILFYVFWEVSLIPMYFLIGIWGSRRRIYAAVKFFIYTMAGSLLMLAGIVILYFLLGTGNFDLVEMIGVLRGGEPALSPGMEYALFAMFFLAFAVKVPVFPLHTWLPDAHTEAPTAASVILAGVLLKMGAYGLLRFCLPLFPWASAQLAPAICVLALIGIIYGALVAMVQPDLKRLVAYSSVSHLGFVVLGIFSFSFQSMEGAAYQMLNHGVSTGALFLLVGILYDRRHTRRIDEFGGLAHSMPCYSACFFVVLLGSIGLPGLGGFVGEFLILQGTFLTSVPAAAVAVCGVVLSAAYMLWMYQRVFLGRVEKEANRRLPDLSFREGAMLIPAIALSLWMGIGSGTFLRTMDSSIQLLVDRLDQVQNVQVVQNDGS